MLNLFSGSLQALLAPSNAKLSHMNENFKDRMKRMRLRAGLKSHQEAADAIGCKRGNVGMWEAPSSAVDSVGSKYLLAVASVYKVRPGYINSGMGNDEYPWLGESIDTQQSQPLRLNVEMIRDVAQALHDIFKEDGSDYRIEQYPELFAEFYEMRLGMEPINSLANAVLVGKWIERNKRGEVDGGATHMPAESSDTKKTRGRKKK
jgi:hypothetical protein